VWGLPTLPEALIGRLDAQVATFASRMRQGLLAASVAIGFEVLVELVSSEVVELRAPTAATMPAVPTSAAAR
jgi:hypothetical protein